MSAAPARSPKLEPPTVIRALPADDRAEVIARLNEEFAVVVMPPHPVVLRETFSADGAPEMQLLSVPGFHELLRPRVFFDGDRKRLQASKVWIESEQRRQYDGIVFDPTRPDTPHHYNLWRGFAVQPNVRGAKGCARFLDHLYENVCRGADTLFAWVVSWFAAIVQYPARKSGTALVLRGGQGTGKSIVGETVGSLLRPHYRCVSDPRYIVGRFNSHLTGCLLLQLDEATWGGDHAAAGKLKDLITGESQLIEYKGREPIELRNHVRLLITGNNSWLVPAGNDERRFAVLDVGDDHQQDRRYFAAIAAEMNAGGREALLHHLLHFPLSDVDVTRVPRTEALAEQKVASMAPEQQWWLDVLRNGVLPGDTAAAGKVAVERLYQHYIDRMTGLGVSRRLSTTAFGIALRKTCPNVERIRETRGQRAWTYTFPRLSECRESFARMSGGIDVSDEGGDAEWQSDQAA